MQGAFTFVFVEGFAVQIIGVAHSVGKNCSNRKENALVVAASQRNVIHKGCWRNEDIRFLPCVNS